jgi:hypothetical protein
MYTIPSASFLSSDCICRDKNSSVSGGSMQSVEVGVLFETTICPLLPSYHCFYIHLPCRIPPLPRWFLTSRHAATVSPLSGPFLVRTCYVSQLHSEFGTRVVSTGNERVMFCICSFFLASVDVVVTTNGRHQCINVGTRRLAPVSNP